MPDIETPAVADTPPDAGGAGGAPEWDGADWSALDKQPWWKTVPESARGHITKAHEERTASKTRADYLDRLFSADDDVLRKDYETTKAECDALKAERDGLKTSLEGIEARRADEESEREYNRLEAKYPDIFKDHFEDPEKAGELLPKGAYVTFVKLIQGGFDEETAAVMARTAMTKAEVAAEVAAAPAAPAGPPKTRDVKPPPSIAHAGKGGANPAATTNARDASENLAQRAKRIQKQYEDEEKAAEANAR